MSKKVKVLIATLAVAALLVAAFASTALAHDPADVDAAAGQDWCGQTGWGHHHGHGVIYSETVSELLLGLTTEEIQAERQEGKSLVEIAAAQGVSEDELVEAIMAAEEEAIQEAVEAGICIEEEAEQHLQRMEQRIRQAVNWTGSGSAEAGEHCGYGQAGPGTGMMGQWDRQDDGRSPYGGMGFGMGQGGMHGWGSGMH